MAAIKLGIGDWIEYRVFSGHKKYYTKSGTIVDMTASCCVIDLGKYRDTILIKDLNNGVVKITDFKLVEKGEKQMAKIVMPSVEYLMELFEKSGRNISRTAKSCEPIVSDTLMGKWLRETGIIPAKGIRALKKDATVKEEKLPTIKESVTPEETVPAVNNDLVYSPDAIKKMVDFCMAPLQGRIDKIEASLAALAKLILHTDGKEKNEIAVAAELIVQVARRWQYEDCRSEK